MSETEHRWRCSYTNLMDGSIQTWDKLPLQSWSNTIDKINQRDLHAHVNIRLTTFLDHFL
jgi:hypothetical protein